jgi:hypothetical protein
LRLLTREKVPRIAHEPHVLVFCSDTVYLLNVTVAGIYNTGYPGTATALRVGM